MNHQLTSFLAAVTGLIKLALQAGKANPAPPVGPALGAKVLQPAVFCKPTWHAVSLASDHHCLQGVNIMAFCKEYNAATQDKVGTVIPVEITVFEVSNLISGCALSHTVVVPVVLPASDATDITFHDDALNIVNCLSLLPWSITDHHHRLPCQSSPLLSLLPLYATMYRF